MTSMTFLKSCHGAWRQPDFKGGDDRILALALICYQKKTKKRKQCIDFLGQELILKVGFNDPAGNRSSPSVSLPIAIPYTFQYFYSAAHPLDFKLLVSSNPAF